MKADRKDIMVKVDIVVSVFAVVHLLATENEIYDDVFHCEIHVKANETPHNSPRQFPTECTNKMNGHEIYTCNKKKVHPHSHSKWINRGQFLFYWRKIHNGLLSL